MAGLIESDMSDCLEQMARLQTKMEFLQQEKNKRAAEEVIKQTETEPNLKIMSDWLKEYGETIQEIMNERIIEEQYRELDNKIDRGLESKIETYEKIKNIDQEDTNLIRKIRGSLELPRVLTTKEILEKARIRYEPTPEEYHLYKNRNIITERYNDLLDKRNDRNGRNGKKVGKTLHECDLSINTYFMKQYIEATHNMFLIQQKRIDELERKINES